MKEVFVDTSYWIAISNRKDQWHDTAKRAKEKLTDARLVTTEEVLVEFLTALSGRRPYLRIRAAKAVRGIVNDPNVSVVPQSHDSFLKGLERYENRIDKSYSLQDCISMNTMEARSIAEVLTSDRDFEREGFTILMRDEAR